MYVLISENLSRLGGPMGSETTSINFRKYFLNLVNAKLYAEKDFRKDDREIKWKKHGKGWTSGDMSYVMYKITPIKIED